MKMVIAQDEVILESDDIVFAFALSEEQKKAARGDLTDKQMQVMFRQGGSVHLSVDFGEFVEALIRIQHPQKEGEVHE